MKTVNVLESSEEVVALLEHARQEDVLIRASDGTEFMLTAVDDFDYEVAQTRRNAALMSLLDARAKQTQTIPLAEVKRQLGLER